MSAKKAPAHKFEVLPPSQRTVTVRRPEDLLSVLDKAFPNDSKEHFYAIYLDARHRLMAEPDHVSTGSLNASLVHPREVFGPALTVRAAALIVAHNHPSGDDRPSADDLELTGRLDKCSELLGVALLDHVIVCVGDLHGRDTIKMTSIREYGWPSKANDE